ncbi:MAG TPA: cyclopropane-fatty-acyl-phospholipid synthase family protein [Jatrophihabitantaceae bacterium]|jgi:cyclopropane-fatty-acyl-phospholipid synthase
MTLTETAPTQPVDPRRWPDVAAAPDSPVRAAVVRRIFRHAASRLPLRVVETNGPSYGGGNGADPVMRLVRPTAFFHRVGATGTIGFGEAYMAGDWTAEDLTGVLAAFAAHVRELVPAMLQRLRGAVLRRQPADEDNTVAGAKRNIQRHYDLSNDMFQLFLDPSMTYSSALYEGDPDGADENLATAQHRKIDRLLDCAGVREGTRLLEIGTGWGELAIRAARRGAQVTSLTISTEQADLARRRIAEAGQSDRVDVLLQDYRTNSGRYDAAVSVEMIEAVGVRHWPDYFRTVDRALVPGGRFGLQAILQDDASVRRVGETYTWIRKYIFPGGQLSSVESIERTVQRHTSLRITDRLSFGKHYAETLRRWRARFEARATELARLGFDETFRRMWSFYLAYSEAGFRTGYLDVDQITLAKPGTPAPA